MHTASPWASGNDFSGPVRQGVLLRTCVTAGLSRQPPSRQLIKRGARAQRHPQVTVLSSQRKGTLGPRQHRRLPRSPTRPQPRSPLPDPRPSLGAAQSPLQQHQL